VETELDAGARPPDKVAFTMPDARLYIEEDVDPAAALERATAAWRALDASCPVAMYGATLRGDAWLLGAHQHAGQVLPGREPGAAGGAPPLVLRRPSGGVAVRAGEGVSYFALALYDRSSLMPCPRSRILNRNVRGALAGFRKAGVIAHYFGRDFLSVDARPAAYVGWAARADGRVLLEFFICESSSCFIAPRELGYPARTNDPFRGKEPWTLQQAVGTVIGAEKREPVRGRSLLEHVARGYQTGFAAEVVQSPIPEAWLRAEPRAGLPPDPDASALHWSHPIEEAIGFVSAGVAIDGAGKLARVRMCGDFFADDNCAITLERMLIGVEPATDHIARAVDNAYGQAGHDVEGVRDLHTFQTAILDAVARARAA
jgi:hypothetical protein